MLLPILLLHGHCVCYLKMKLRWKFDTVYFVSTEQLTLTKIYGLEIWHRVDLGCAYLNNNAGKEFTNYIAESSRQNLLSTLATDLGA